MPGCRWETPDELKFAKSYARRHPGKFRQWARGIAGRKKWPGMDERAIKSYVSRLEKALPRIR